MRAGISPPSPASTASSSRPPAEVSAARIACSSTPSPCPEPSRPAARPASLPTSAAAASSIRAASPPFPLPAEGKPRSVYRPGRAHRLADRAHLLHQVSEPLVLGHLPARLVQLWPGPQVHVDGLAADPAGQVPLRPVTPVARLRARAVRLAAPAPHPVQRAPAEVPDLRDQREQLGARRSSHARSRPDRSATQRLLPDLSYNITQTSRATCVDQEPSRFSRAPFPGVQWSSGCATHS